ncbi:MAG: hypothetical protein ACP5HQ_01385 [Thermoprotei archaeon]
MPALGEFFLVVAAVLLGILVISYISAVLVPQENFAMSQQRAINLASSSTIAVGPLMVDPVNRVASAVFEFYNPGVSTNLTVIVFQVNSSLVSSVGQLVPNSLPAYIVYLPSGSNASVVKIDTPIYDLSGRVLLNGTYKVYTVPANVPFTVKVYGVSSNQVLVIWFLWYTGGYWFRVSYSFTGVPPS